MTAVSGEILNPSFALIDIMNGMCFQPPQSVNCHFNTHQWNMCSGMIEDINAFERKMQLTVTRRILCIINQLTDVITFYVKSMKCVIPS